MRGAVRRYLRIHAMNINNSHGGGHDDVNNVL